MGHVEVAHLSHALPDGRALIDDASFRVGEGTIAALVGPNGAGKTTLIRLVAGDVQPQSGTVSFSGGLGIMRQFVGGIRAGDSQGMQADTGALTGESSVRDLLISVASLRLRAAAARLDAAELAMMERDDETTQMRYAAALAEWGDAGGYDAEVLWDACCVAALGTGYEQCRWREVGTLSGGEQKRLVLEALLRGPADVLLLDEPDNYLDVPGKRWLEQQLATTAKTVLLVSHDRELLANSAQRIVTVEDGSVWIHGGGFATYAQARRDRNDRLDELRRRWDEEHEKLKQLVRMYRQKASYNDAMASRLQAAETRLSSSRTRAAGTGAQGAERPDAAARRPDRETGDHLREAGADRAHTAVSTEIWYGERVAVLGANGSGKSSFLRLLGGEPLPHDGVARLGARVVPGLFVQTHARPDLAGRWPEEILMTEHALLRNEAMAALARYEIQFCARQPFRTLSGGQQARLQILLLELAGSTLLLLDEPTDNLDLSSAEALQEGLESYQGSVLAVTHDRWFARSFDRFLVFRADGNVQECDSPVWDETRPVRPN